MSLFDACAHDMHAKCNREFKQFYIDHKTNKPVYTGSVIKCECKKRGCKCYVKPAERASKTNTRRRRRKQ